MDTKAVSDHFPALLQQTAATVCAVLNDVLPSASEHWWEELVLPNLSAMQKKAVDSKGVDTLSGLDLGAILRVLDRNWHLVSEKLGLPWESRNFVREMMTIRTRWAHASVKQFAPRDVYRDLDTVHRFLESLGDQKLSAQIEQAMQAVASHLVEISALIELLEQCERDTEKWLGPVAAKRLAKWRTYRSNPAELIKFLQRLLRGPKRFNGRILHQHGGLSIERIVIENPQYFTPDDVRTARETLGL